MLSFLKLMCRHTGASSEPSLIDVREVMSERCMNPKHGMTRGEFVSFVMAAAGKVKVVGCRGTVSWDKAS